MVAVNLKSLVGKLNDVCRRALEAAAGLCLSRTHYDVEIEHWLLKLMDMPNTDLDAVLRHYGIEASRLSRDLTGVIARLKTGNARPPALSPRLVDLVREAWVVASLEFGAAQIRSGHLLCALWSDETLSRIARDTSRMFEKLPVETLRRELPGIVAATAEAEPEPAADGTPPGRAAAPSGGAKMAALDQFTIDLTARARKGDIDRVLGRDAEVRQIVDILMRRRQNNPILTGEAGVGKTAVVEGFAQRIADGDVPPLLANVVLRVLDLGLLQAGAGIKGEFENRLKSVIDEVKRSPQPIILFIDEAHTLIGAGGQAGQGDAANMLKPALARGELRTIAATTWAEYKKYFEKDAALARRFQVVKVEEPSEESAIEMMHGLVATLEKHHQVRILDEAVTDAVRLSHRFISGRQLPDKSVSLLDTACARVAIGQAACPPAVEDCRRRIDQLNTRIEILTREQLTLSDNQTQLDALIRGRAAAETELETLEARWKQEAGLVARVRTLRRQLEAPLTTASGATAADVQPRLETCPASSNSGGLATLAPPASAAPSADRQRLREELAAKNRCCACASIPRPLPKWSPAGPVFPWDGWWPTRFVRSSRSRSKSSGGSSVNPTPWRSSPNASARRGPGWSIRAGRSAYSCWSAPAAWAKRRPRSAWPSCSMAAIRI